MTNPVHLLVTPRKPLAIAKLMQCLMRFGLIGLGRIGRGLAHQALEKGHQVVGYDTRLERIQMLGQQDLEPAPSLKELVRTLISPRLILIYVPHGEPTEQTITALKGHLQPGDIVADGGNSYWQDSVRRYEELRSKGIAFLDVGTSGGTEGARHGACFMVGGEAERRLREPHRYCMISPSPRACSM
jgi:6-phosphogluconate dehydrogenase